MTQAEANQLQEMKTEMALLSATVARLDATVQKLLDVIAGDSGLCGRVQMVEKQLANIEEGKYPVRADCTTAFRELRGRINHQSVTWVRAWAPVAASMIAAGAAIYVASH